MAIDGRFAVRERRGIGKGTLELLRGLVRLETPLRYEILVDRLPPPGLIPPAANWRWRRLRPSLYPIWEQARLPAYLAGNRPALMHASGNTGPLLGPGRLLLTVHDLIFLERWPLRSVYQRAGRAYRRLVVPRAIERAAWLIVDSRRTADDVARRFPRAARRMSVIGIPVAEHFFRAPRRSAIERGSRLLAFGGRDPRKNVPRIVAAFARLRLQRPDAQLLLVGSQGALDTDAGPGVQPLPYVTEERLLELYLEADALVYPSLSEGFGVPILEAMAMGVPVITSNRDPLRELAGEAAVLVDPEQVGSIAAAMTRLLDDEGTRRRLVGAGRRQAEAFRPQVVAAAVMELYCRLVGLAASSDPIGAPVD